MDLIKGFEDYQITDDGRVWSNKRKIWLKPLINNSGYHQVRLRKDGKYYMKCIHKLVAETYIPNPNNYTEVDHLDTNTSNNTVSNLCWCNRLMNNSNPLTKQHRSEAAKGNTNKKGVKLSEETKLKISMALKGRTPWNKKI